MIRRLIVFLAIVAMPELSMAATYITRFNPFTGHLDYVTKLTSDTLPGGSTYYLSGLSVSDEGAFQGNVSSLNFVGTGISVTVNGGTATVTANGGAAGGGGGSLSMRIGDTFTTISTIVAAGNVDFQIVSGSGIVKVDLSSIGVRADNLDSSTATLLTAIKSTAAAATTRFNNLDISTNTLNSAILQIATEAASGGGGGVKSLYLSTNVDTSNNNLYYLMFTTPSLNGEVTKTASVSAANGLVILSSHSTLASGLGNKVNLIPAGFWQFVTFAGEDSIVGQTDLVVDVSTMSRTGTNAFRIVSATITNINTTAINLFEAESIVSSDISISTDDRVLVMIYAKTTSALARTVSMTFQGTSRCSRLGTTIERNPTFIGLNDTPNTYAGQAGKFPQVGVGESSLIFVSLDTTTNVGDGLGSHVSTQPLNLGNLPIFNASSATITGVIKVGSMTSVGSITTTSPVIVGELQAWTTAYTPIAHPLFVGIATSTVKYSTMSSFGRQIWEAKLSSYSQWGVYELFLPPAVDSTTDPTLLMAMTVSTGVEIGTHTIMLSISSVGTPSPSDLLNLVYQTTVTVNLTTITVTSPTKVLQTAVVLTGWGAYGGTGNRMLYIRVANVPFTTDSNCQRYFHSALIAWKRRT